MKRHSQQLPQTGGPRAGRRPRRRVWLAAGTSVVVLVAAVVGIVMLVVIPSDPFVGTWVDQDRNVVRLRNDGTGDVGMENKPPAQRLRFQYNVDHHMLLVVFSPDVGHDPNIVNWQVSKDGQSLRLEGVISGRYHRHR